MSFENDSNNQDLKIGVILSGYINLKECPPVSKDFVMFLFEIYLLEYLLELNSRLYDQWSQLRFKIYIFFKVEMKTVVHRRTNTCVLNNTEETKNVDDSDVQNVL